MNPYAYVRNAPIDNSDPFGLALAPGAIFPPALNPPGKPQPYSGHVAVNWEQFFSCLDVIPMVVKECMIEALAAGAHHGPYGLAVGAGITSTGIGFELNHAYECLREASTPIIGPPLPPGLPNK
jgi:hypothetical protein